jgi:preprotein translocase subunit SecE
MSLIKSEDSKKWVNSFVAICAVLSGYIVIQFTEKMGEWFDLEAKIPYFLGVSQAIGIVIGLAVFLFVTNHKGARTYLEQVYDELVKVIWPESESVVKSTIGILIGLVIFSAIFVSVDFLFRKALELVY